MHLCIFCHFLTAHKITCVASHERYRIANESIKEWATKSQIIFDQIYYIHVLFTEIKMRLSQP